MDRTPPPPPDPQLAQQFQLERFRDYLALEAGNSRHTVENYLRDITRLAEYATGKGIKQPQQLAAAQLRDFIYFLKDLGLAPTTIRRQISAIRTYFKFLLGDGVITVDPSDSLEMPRPARELPDVLTTAEIDRLIESVPQVHPM